MKVMSYQVLFGCLLVLSSVTFGSDAAKSRVDAFLTKEFEGGALKCMSCVYEQHGKTRYEFVTQRGWDGFDAQTPVHVASITKVFTATLVMQFAEEGKLSLLDYVTKYIPEFQGKDVTILNLMTHTSGWRNKTGHVARSVDTKLHDEFYATMFKEFEVGEQFRYMSQGYDILAEICEKVSGANDVADLARDRIFRPLGMSRSAFAAHQGQAGMQITASDLVKFGRHLLDIKRTRKNGILTPMSVDVIFRRCLKPEFNRTPVFFVNSGSVGFGQYFSVVNSPEAVGHAGATGCFLLIDPVLDAVEVVLTNRQDERDTHFSSCDGNFARIFAIMATNFGDEPIGDRDKAKGGDFGLKIDRDKAAAESERVAAKQAKELGLTSAPYIAEPRPKDHAHQWGMFKEDLNEIKNHGANGYDLVLFGDSISDNWSWMSGDSMRALGSGYGKVLNMGIGGDRTENLLWRLENGALDGYKTRYFNLLIGTNNSFQKNPCDKPEDIAKAIRIILDKIIAKHPESKILLMPILPYQMTTNPQGAVRRANNEAVNKLIVNFADNKKVFWVDVRAPFMNADGSCKSEFYTEKLLDGMGHCLHPSSKAYKEILAPAIKAAMTDLDAGRLLRTKP